MLVLSRKSGEKIYIGGTIEVTVIKLRGNRVSLGVIAPKEVKVLRGELFERWALSEGRSTPVECKNTLALAELTPASKDTFLAWSI